MRTTSIDLYTSDDAEAITFGLGEKDPSAQYLVREIVGLDAEDIVPKFYGFGANSGAQFFDFVLKPRDIVMRIVLQPRVELDESFSDVRDHLYRAISSTRRGKVELQFKEGPVAVAKISGAITKFETSLFVQLPEVQLTISCPDPIFRAMKSTDIAIPDIPTVNPFHISDGLSTAPHGFIMQMVFTTAEDTFEIQDVDTDPDWVFKIAPDGGFEVDDILYISSEYTNKQCYLVRMGDATLLADKVWPGSNWPVMFPGKNTFHFPEIASFDWQVFNYSAAYWGV